MHVFYWPERSLAVRFRVAARDPSGRLGSFMLTVETRPAETRSHSRSRSPAATSAARGSPPGCLRDPVAVVGPYLVWAFPFDPSLPGLPAAASPAVVRDHIVRDRIVPWPTRVRVEPLRYRPRRRAVLRYHVTEHDAPGVLFAKVLAPARADAALARASALRAGAGARPLHLALPVARTAPGALLVPPIEGCCLRDLLLSGRKLPSPERVAGISDDLAALAPVGAGSMTPADGASAGRNRPRLLVAERAGQLLVRLVPSTAAAVGRVLEAVTRGLDDDPVDDRLVHGDLYEAQIFVTADFTLGLVDLDDVGPGDPVLDAANFSAHLLMLALSHPSAADRLLAYRSLLRRGFLDRLDVGAASLAWREAFAMLLLATGPFRVLHPQWPREVAARVEVAERLLAGV